MTHPLSKTRIDECSNEIPVFLFFTWARNNSSDCGKRFIPSMIQRTLKFTLVWDVIPLHTFTAYQWFRPLLAWCHCRCESNQGCTSHTRISQSNLFSSFLPCDVRILALHASGAHGTPCVHDSCTHQICMSYSYHWCSFLLCDSRAIREVRNIVHSRKVTGSIIETMGFTNVLAISFARDCWNCVCLSYRVSYCLGPPCPYFFLYYIFKV